MRITILAAAFVTLAQASPPRDGAAAPLIGTASVAGIVLEQDAAGTPVRRAVVTIAGAELAAPIAVVTDDEGRWRVDELPAGRFTITATKTAYLPSVYGATRPGRPGTLMAVGVGQQLGGIRLVLVRGGVITGTVRDEDGMPAAGTSIVVARVGEPFAMGGMFTAERIVTDDRGEYRVFGLAPGEYLVGAVPMASFGGEIGLMTAEEIDAALGGLQRRAGLLGGPARGTTAPAGAPSVPGTFGPATGSVGYAVTFFPGTPDPANAMPLSVTAGSERSGIDFLLAPVRTAIIEGIVVGPGSANVSLAMAPHGRSTPVSLPLAPQLERPFNSADGTFRYRNVSPGRYLISARVSGPAGGARPQPAAPASGRDFGAGISGIAPSASTDALWALAEVFVNGADVSGVTLALQPGLRFDGRVVFQPGSAPIDALVDLSAMRVTLVPDGMGGSAAMNGTVFNLPQRPASASVREDGTFQVLGLVPGRYILRTTLPVDAAKTWTIRSAVLDGRDLLDEPFDVTAARDLPGAVLTFTDARSELGGTLTAASGAAAPDYSVIVFPADRRLWASTRRVASTRPASDGRFVFPDLPPGDYWLAALTDVEPDEWKLEAFLDALVPSSIGVTVGEGERKVQDIRIAR
jgi:hypothetical protein